MTGRPSIVPLSRPNLPIKVGDSFTIAGVYPLYRNPDRRWWQVWKPRWVREGFLQTFKVTETR